MKTRYSSVLLLSIAGLALFMSWYIPARHGFRSSLDAGISRFFNHKLVESPLFLWVVTITNNRASGGCLLLAIGTSMLHFWLKETSESRRRVAAIGLVILLTAVVLDQLGRALVPVKRTSPTLMLDNIYRASELLHVPIKDMSRDSFPGDHGMMLLISSAFMLRCSEKVAGIIDLIIAVVFAFPRVMIDAHWFTDIVVGSMTVVSTGLSWWLMTPLGDRLVTLSMSYLPGEDKQFLNKQRKVINIIRDTSDSLIIPGNISSF